MKISLLTNRGLLAEFSHHVPVEHNYSYAPLSHENTMYTTMVNCYNVHNNLAASQWQQVSLLHAILQNNEECITR